MDAPGISKMPVVLLNGSCAGWDAGRELWQAGLSSRAPWQGSKGVSGGFGAQWHLQPLCRVLPWGSRPPPGSKGNSPLALWSGGDRDVKAASRLGSRGRACRMAPRFWVQPLALLAFPRVWEHSAPQLAAARGQLRCGLTALALQ